MDTNPREVNGQPVFEGDILLTQEQRRALKERKGQASLSSRWEEGSDGYPLVPYVFSNDCKREDWIGVELSGIEW